ncbi:MAG: preprotein translocase subunit SecA [Candidatus Handelsmanbacteria bacterium]|nr:preprotein translocase subunit SecA [Candidatus Handelsmanbacteria bacterium]
MFSLLRKLFGSQAERQFKAAAPALEAINRHVEEYSSFSPEEFQAKTREFRAVLAERTGVPAARVRQLEKELSGDLKAEERLRLNDELDELDREIRRLEGSTLDELAPRAIGLVKAACRHLVGRSWGALGSPVTWDMVPYEVQCFGALVLHQGKIAEMATGEGKTLVATMPLYLNALPGYGVHLITHNNYLAKRDGMWMGPVYNLLGLSVGIIQDARQTGGAEAYLLPVPEGAPQEFVWKDATHKEAYAADVVYATKDQVGFDYLYDNMATRRGDIMQRGFNYAIVDEADSNLIDDARTPLIISGPVPESTNRYLELRPLVEKLLRAQTSLANKLVAEAEKKRQEGGDEYEIGIELLKVSRGSPKNRRLMKIMQEEGVKRLISRVESDYMRDKRLQEIDESLYFAVDERHNTIDLTDKGRDLLSPDEQSLFILPDLSLQVDQIRRDAALGEEERRQNEEEAYREHALKSEAVHNINQLMKAYTLFEKDVQYMVTDDQKVVIIDESTGRPQPGRRFSDGLHQALEAKEGVKVEQETQTIATITLQNLFRMYRKLAGMTGTAETEAHELYAIYKLDVVVVPTNRPVRRLDQDDQIFRTKKEKYNAIIEEIARLHGLGLPVLVGTISVETSELLSRLLTSRGIKHQLLNARYHEREAQIVAQAGQLGAVTIATNMAGRGTDIKLSPEVVHIDRQIVISQLTLDERLPSGKSLRQTLGEEPAGLQVIGTERHEARRIDRQLRGRAGRQGDPGSSRFFLSLEDDLMRLFGSERIASIMDRLGAEEGEVIEHPMVTRSIERAQKKVEARNFEMRKHLLEYDDVMNQQRQVIYNRRRDVLERDTVRDQVEELIAECLDSLLATHIDEQNPPSTWLWEELQTQLGSTLFIGLPVTVEERETLTAEELRQRLLQVVTESYRHRVEIVGEETFRQIEKAILLHTIDTCWQEHLYEMDELKEGIGFVGVGGKNPLIEYKKGAYDLFESLIERVQQETLRNLFRLRLAAEPGRQALPAQRLGPPRRHRLIHTEATNMGFGPSPEAGPAPAPPGPTPENYVPGQPVPPDRRRLSAYGGGTSEAPPAQREPIRVGPKVGRNDPCPCGSGKKYKKCHGINEA